MKQIAAIEFRDQAEGGEGLAFVRAKQGGVGLTLSLLEEGDVEVFLEPRHARQLIAALERAVEVAESGA